MPFVAASAASILPLVPFGAVASSTFNPSVGGKTALSVVYVAASSLTTLSRAGRLASGRSFGAEGEEGSSRGRLVEGTAAAELGDADMVENVKIVWDWYPPSFFFFQMILLVQVMYTRRLEREVLVLDMGRWGWE